MAEKTRKDFAILSVTQDIRKAAFALYINENGMVEAGGIEFHS